jgi:D-glycero-alpha-D-manno-heptose-7-phosphate kinase
MAGVETMTTAAWWASRRHRVAPRGGVLRVAVPLRVSFAGGGTDVPPFPETEGGVVLSATIDRFVRGTLTPCQGDDVVVDSDGDLDLRAVGRGLGLAGHRVTVRSDVPPGSGLGSSSAAVVALVLLARGRFGLDMSNKDIAALAHRIERVDLGIGGGLQDHYATTFGGFNLIEFGTDVRVRPVPVAESVVRRLAAGLLLCFTGVTRRSAPIIADQSARVRGREERVLAGLRAQKALAMDLRTALVAGDLDLFGDLLGEAWTRKKQLSPLITTPRIDEAYDLALRSGARGGKITGAGGGGHLLLYCDPAARDRVGRALARFGGTVAGVGFPPAGPASWSA